MILLKVSYPPITFQIYTVWAAVTQISTCSKRVAQERLCLFKQAHGIELHRFESCIPLGWFKNAGAAGMYHLPVEVECFMFNKMTGPCCT